MNYVARMAVETIRPLTARFVGAGQPLEQTQCREHGGVEQERTSGGRRTIQAEKYTRLGVIQVCTSSCCVRLAGIASPPCLLPSHFQRPCTNHGGGSCDTQEESESWHDSTHRVCPTPPLTPRLR